MGLGRRLTDAVQDGWEKRVTDMGDISGTRRVSVLIVEDDGQDYLLTVECLKGSLTARFDVARASNMDEAQKTMKQSGLDVILLDLALPDASGWEALQNTAEHAGSVPIIVLTGRSDENTGVEAIRHGAQDYVSKSELTTRQLIRAIRHGIERKKSEEALRMYRDRLEQLVDRRTSKLQDALRQVEEHDRAKTRFVAGITHDLKSPIAAMGFTIENLMKGVAGEMPPKAAQYLQMLRDDCRLVTRTVADIVDLSQIEEHRLTLSKVPLPFPRFCMETIRVLHENAAHKSVALDVVRSANVGFVTCDPFRLERAVMNVVDNAIKYTPSGGRDEVVVRCTPHDSRAVLEIVDTGHGITPDDLPYVMDPFRRGNSRIAGTGLGLCVTREIVELHGGAIEIQSPPENRDCGTSVTIEIPLGEPSTVLIVDDNAATRGALTDQLEHEGYTVMNAPSAEECMHAARDISPAAALIDLALPNRNTLHLLAQIKADSVLRGMPVITLTDGEITPHERVCLQELAIPVIHKPGSPDEIASTVYHSILGRHYAVSSGLAP